MKRIILAVRSACLIFLTHKIALPLLKRIRKANPFPARMEDLLQFPPGCLGRDLYDFLEKRDLPLLPHYARHDLKHVLLNYDTTDEGEVCLQSFMLGNGRISFPVMATVIYGFVTMPEYWKKMRVAFKSGRKSNSIHSWAWHEILNEPTQELRNKIFTHI